MGGERVTRGHGFLEPFLARKRASMANALIPAPSRSGRILDVGCGSSPFFLQNTQFAEKFGVDKMAAPGVLQNGSGPGIRLEKLDVYESDSLPFEGDTFDVVTMLAVFEHIRVDRLIGLITDIHRVLKPGGVYVMTTPSGWTGPILDTLKFLRLVSPEEINEHEDSYSVKKIKAIMAKTPFAPDRTRYGYFELGMNVWMQAKK